MLKTIGVGCGHGSLDGDGESRLLGLFCSFGDGNCCSNGVGGGFGGGYFDITTEGRGNGDGYGTGDGSGYGYGPGLMGVRGWTPPADAALTTVMILNEDPLTMVYQAHSMQTPEYRHAQAQQ